MKSYVHVMLNSSIAFVQDRTIRPTCSFVASSSHTGQCQQQLRDNANVKALLKYRTTFHTFIGKKKKNWPRKWLTFSVWVRAWNTRWLTTGPFTTTQLVEYCLNAKEHSELVTKRISISWNLVVNRNHFAGFQFFQKKWRIIIPKYETISQEVDLQS